MNKFFTSLLLCLTLFFVPIKQAFSCSGYEECKILAENGFDYAQYNLGLYYYHGHGVEKDTVKALEWYLLAAQQGHTLAQTSVGQMYKIGDGTEIDLSEAYTWLSFASEKQDLNASYELGEMYFNGKGVEQDYIKAKELLEQPAKKANPKAQYLLGLIYAQGLGVESNLIEGYAWINASAYQKFEMAYSKKDEIRRQMNRKQVQIANNLSNKYIRTYVKEILLRQD
jgi:TPR repeat protein